MIEVNCAALPRERLESELFGHESGAFTGATARHRGLLEQADGGTLFMDEIGEMPPDLQAKLLKAIEDHKVRRLYVRQKKIWMIWCRYLSPNLMREPVSGSKIFPRMSGAN
jgi:transcriptional regulator with GAF, ATPase, and Fis domain